MPSVHICASKDLSAVGGLGQSGEARRDSKEQRGMIHVPGCGLYQEAQSCYSSLSRSTDSCLGKRAKKRNTFFCSAKLYTGSICRVETV